MELRSDIGETNLDDGTGMSDERRACTNEHQETHVILTLSLSRGSRYGPVQPVRIAGVLPGVSMVPDSLGFPLTTRICVRTIESTTLPRDLSICIGPDPSRPSWIDRRWDN
jgi:hypothetical protein